MEQQFLFIQILTTIFFFNLINNLYTRILGIRDFYELLDSIYLLRSIQAIFALITVYYSFLIVRTFYNKTYAFIVPIILCSTIPFLNFSLQLRGYNLSMMFSVMLLFYAWNYSYKKRIKDIILTALLVFCLLYTIPSNAYFLFALCTSILFKWNRERNLYKKQIRLNNIKKKVQNFQSFFDKIDKTYLFIFTAIFIGMVLSYIAYLPVMENLLNNRFVSKVPEERDYVFTTLLPHLLNSFLSERWLLLLIFPMALLLSPLFNSKIKRSNNNKLKISSLLSILLLPFLFALLHNKIPFQRTFIVLVPVFAMTLSVWIIQIIERLDKKENFKSFLLLTLTIYLVITSGFVLNKNDEQLNSNLLSETKEQNIYNNFYLAKNFNPNEVAKKIAEINSSKTPVIMIDELDRVSLTYYMEKFNVLTQAAIRIQNKQVNVKGQNFKQVGIIQKSAGKNKEIKYTQIPCNLSLNKKLNPYLLLLSLNIHHNSDKCFLLSAYPNRIEAFKKNTANQYQIKKNRTRKLYWTISSYQEKLS